MTGFFIAIGLFLVFVLVMGFRHDRRQRKIGSVFRRSQGHTRLDNQTKADLWGGPG